MIIKKFWLIEILRISKYKDEELFNKNFTKEKISPTPTKSIKVCILINVNK